MRPIDGDVLYDLVEGRYKFSSGIEHRYERDLLDLICSMPTLTPPNEWVSVEERLPENYTDVLCWYEYFRYGDYNRMYQTYGIGYCINGQWGGEVSNGTKCKVLYWQPLPAPPDRRPPEGEEDSNV